MIDNDTLLQNELQKYLSCKVLPLIRSDIKIVKYYLIVPLKRDHPSLKATFSFQKGWP